MYAAHAALALVARGMRDEPPLWAMLLAALAPDTVKVGILLAGFAKPVADLYSHSMPAVVVLAVVATAFGWQRWGRGGGMVLATLVVAHLVLDLIFWRERLWPGLEPVGLALAFNAMAEFTVEAGMVLVGWLLYRRTIALRTRNRWPAWMLLAGLLAAQGGFVWYLLVD